MSTAKKESRQWKPIETPYGQTEFGTRNQAHADLNTFKAKHKKKFGKIPVIKYTESYVTKKIKGEKHECYEYKAELKTSISLFKGTFVGKSLTSREDAMKKAVELANQKLSKPKKSPKKERENGVVRRFGRIRLNRIVKNVFKRA